MNMKEGEREYENNQFPLSLLAVILPLLSLSLMYLCNICVMCVSQRKCVMSYK